MVRNFGSAPTPQRAVRIFVPSTYRNAYQGQLNPIKGRDSNHNAMARAISGCVTDAVTVTVVPWQRTYPHG